MSKKVLIELVDGAIVDIDTYQDYTSGCETCDYGSSYETEIFIYYRNRGRDTIRDDSPYKYGIAMSDMIKLVINYQEDIKKLKECEVAEFIKDKLENEYNCCGIEIRSYK